MQQTNDLFSGDLASWGGMGTHTEPHLLIEVVLGKEIKINSLNYQQFHFKHSDQTPFQIIRAK